jgi:hypothetical protein
MKHKRGKAVSERGDEVEPSFHDAACALEERAACDRTSAQKLDAFAIPETNRRENQHQTFDLGPGAANGCGNGAAV